MIKRTLYFGNPAHIYLRNAQLCISYGRKNETDDEKDIIRSHRRYRHSDA
jgi:hypothetical protein